MGSKSVPRVCVCVCVAGQSAHHVTSASTLLTPHSSKAQIRRLDGTGIASRLSGLCCGRQAWPAGHGPASLGRPRRAVLASSPRKRAKHRGVERLLPATGNLNPGARSKQQEAESKKQAGRKLRAKSQSPEDKSQKPEAASLDLLAKCRVRSARKANDFGSPQ